MELKELIGELRGKTGAGMMDCKKALEASGGKLDEAETFLRKKGLADAAKRSARTTKEGLIAFSGGGKTGGLIELNCETDFVARNSEFAALAGTMAKQVASGELGCADCAKPMIEPVFLKLKENMGLRRFERFELKGPGFIAGYIHLGGKRGAMIELSAPNEQASSSPELAELAKELLLQIVGMTATKYLKREDIPQADVDREKEIYAEVVRKEGKPEAAIPKIVEGKLNKLFFQACCLMDQLSVRDGKVPVKKLLADAGAKLGGEVRVRRFVRYQLGE